MKFQIAAIGAFILAALAAPAFAQTPALVTEEMMVKTGDPGIEIYVRNKRPADMTTFRPEQTVLYVHGATYPSETAFDLKLDGVSWMEYIASRGYDVWLVDLRGYGKSTRPPEMADKPEANPPIVRGDTAVKDIGTAVDFILQRRNIPRLNLLGWSWGTTLMATYTTQNAAEGRAPGAVRAGLDPADGIAGAGGSRAAAGVPDGQSRTGQAALVHRRCPRTRRRR